MMTQINSVLLCNITQQLANGRPIWAMARVNEYLEPTDPLRRALAQKALRLVSQAISPDIVQKIIISGDLYNTLSENEKEEIRANEPAVTTAPTKFILKNKLASKTFNRESVARKTMVKPRVAFA